MTEEEIEAIFARDMTPEESKSFSSFVGDRALEGLKIIQIYFPNHPKVIAGASHDLVYSVSVSDAIKAGITEEDALRLKRLNWMVQDDALAIFV